MCVCVCEKRNWVCMLSVSADIPMWWADCVHLKFTQHTQSQSTYFSCTSGGVLMCTLCCVCVCVARRHTTSTVSVKGVSHRSRVCASVASIVWRSMEWQGCVTLTPLLAGDNVVFPLCIRKSATRATKRTLLTSRGGKQRVMLLRTAAHEVLNLIQARERKRSRREALKACSRYKLSVLAIWREMDREVLNHHFSVRQISKHVNNRHIRGLMTAHLFSWTVCVTLLNQSMSIWLRWV